MAINASTSQVIKMMLEQVRNKLEPYLVSQESDFMKLFNRASEKHNVSAFADTGGSVLAWRVPVLLAKGGDYQAISLDGGDLGTGSMMTTNFMAFSTFENDIAFNIPLRAQYATKDSKQAVTNAVQYSLQNAMKEMAVYNEIGFFQDGTGALATANGTGSPAIVSSAVTYNLETSAFSYIRLRGLNALVDVYNAAGVLQFIGARVSNINYAANQVTLSGVSTYTPVNTDIIAFPGMGTPAGTYTMAAGSWRNGLYTFNTTTTSGSIGGLAYSTAYELATPAVNAAGGFFTPSLLYAGKSQLVQRRDDEAYSKIVGVCHMAQRVSWYLQGLTISNWFRGASDKMIDLAPKGTDYGDTFMAGDVKHYVSRRANKSRVDWLDPKNFGWTQLTDIDFIQTLEGQRMFMGRSATTGNPTAGQQFYIQNTRQLYSVDPGCAVVYYGLQIPAGQ